MDQTTPRTRSHPTRRRRIGLLACDTIWEPLRTRHGDYPDMFARWLGTVDTGFELSTWPVYQGRLPPGPDACDAWIISGSRAGVYDDHAWIAPLMHFVRTAYAARRPQLGICFGHQLLAHALGGHTERAAGGWGIGNVTVHLRETAAGAAPREALSLYVAHQDQVMKLPPGAVWLAHTAHCGHAMFALGGHVLGLQPHPEFTAGFMRELTAEDSFPLAADQRATALASYAAPVDNDLVARWAADFLGLGPARGATAWRRWQTI